MTYRIDPAEPVAAEIRRIIGDQLDGAIAALRVPDGPDAEAIHDARRRIKKTRSALRLARPLYGAQVVKLANAELREVAGSIAQQRDADALVEAVDRILHGLADDAPTRPALDRLRGRAADAAQAHRDGGSVGSSTAHGAARRLQQTSDWLQRVPAQEDGWDAIGLGLRRPYARGRKQLHRLGDAPGDEQRHDWRKRAKDLWYHERLLKDLWPKAQKPYVRAASDLADLLGDDHDLSLVRAFLADDASLEVDRQQLATVIDERRADLLARARALGALLYADHPDAWVARHRAWWVIRSEVAVPEVTHAGARDRVRSTGTA